MMTNEKRLIDADALKDNFSFLRKMWSETEICSTVDNAPTVDAVEVVRCKVCRWARPQDHREPFDTPTQSLICECFMHHHIPAPWGARLAVKPDGFCSCGERRTNG